MTYHVEISRPGPDDTSWWHLDNTGSPDQAAAALRELATRVQHAAHHDGAAEPGLCAYLAQAHRPGHEPTTQHGCLRPATLAAMLDRLADTVALA